LNRWSSLRYDTKHLGIRSDRQGEFDVEIKREIPREPLLANFSKNHTEEVMGMAGIKFRKTGDTIQFHCSRAELIGFLAIISRDGKINTDVKAGWVEMSKLQFPLDASGIAVYQR
jgi:hypothetical protein